MIDIIEKLNEITEEISDRGNKMNYSKSSKYSRAMDKIRDAIPFLQD